MDTLILEAPPLPDWTTRQPTAAYHPTVIVVSDDNAVSQSLATICDFLELPLEHLPSHENVADALRRDRPVAIIVDADGSGQDGFNVMMTVSDYDRALPLMLLTGGHPALIGAADAVQEIWGLTDVVTAGSNLGIGGLVDFLLKARAKAGSARLVKA